MIWLIVVAAFFLGFVTDFVWCKWMENVQNKKAFAAANWSLLIIILGFVYTNFIIEKVWLAVTANMIGCYCGTFTAVWKNKKVKVKEEILNGK